MEPHDRRHERTRLVYFVPSPEFGGAEQYVATLVSLLPEDEFEITCIHTHKEALEQLESRVCRADLEFLAVEIGSRPSVWRTVWPLARVIASLHPHIVHCSLVDGYAGAYALLASRLARVPATVGTFHTGKQYPLNQPLDKAFGLLVDSALDAAIAVSRFTKECALQYRAIPQDRVTVIYNGVLMPGALRRAGSGGTETQGCETLTIGTAGRLVPIKCIDTLLLAACQIRRKHENVRFSIIGDGPDRERLASVARGLGLGDAVEFAGWQDDMAAHLRQLDLFVLTSKSEACPMVVLEAMALGLPVIATKVGGLPEIVVDGETGMLVPPEDPTTLARAILALIGDPATRRKLGKAGHERAAALFSADRMMHETRAFYHRLLKRQWQPSQARAPC